MSEQLIDFEIQLTHQQRQVEELNALVYRQQQAIDALTIELRQIKEQLQMAIPSLVREPGEDDPPPHY